MANEVQVVEKANDLKSFLQRDNIRSTLAQAVPAWMSTDRLLRIIFSQAVENPEILECTQVSILRTVMACAQLGLEPILGRAYLVPYKRKRKVGDRWVKVSELQLQIGYQGFIDLARRSGQIKSVFAAAVYDADDFEMTYGTEPALRHSPAVGVDRGSMVGAYCVWTLKDGTKHFEFMSAEDIYKRRAVSKAYQWAETGDPKYGGGKQDSPWHVWPEEMAIKSVIKKTAKMVPLSIEFMEAVEVDNGKPARLEAEHADLFKLNGGGQNALPEGQGQQQEEGGHPEKVDLPAVSSAFWGTFSDLTNTPEAREALERYLDGVARFRVTSTDAVMREALMLPDDFRSAFLKRHPQFQPMGGGGEVDRNEAERQPGRPGTFGKGNPDIPKPPAQGQGAGEGAQGGPTTEDPADYKLKCKVPGCKFKTKTERGLKSHMTRQHPGWKLVDGKWMAPAEPPATEPPATEPPGKTEGGENDVPPWEMNPPAKKPQNDYPEIMKNVAEELRATEAAAEIIDLLAAHEILRDIWERNVMPSPIQDEERLTAALAYLKRQLKMNGNTLGTAKLDK